MRRRYTSLSNPSTAPAVPETGRVVHEVCGEGFPGFVCNKKAILHAMGSVRPSEDVDREIAVGNARRTPSVEHRVTDLAGGN